MAQEEESYTKEEIKKLINQFKEEELPNRNESFHHESEITEGLNDFIRWLNKKK